MSSLLAAVERFKVERPVEGLGFWPFATSEARETSGPCPLCGGTDRCGVNPRKKAAFCRQCGAAGDSLTWAMLLEGLDPKDGRAVADYLRREGYLDGERRPATPEELRQREALLEHQREARAEVEREREGAAEDLRAQAVAAWEAAPRVLSGPAAEWVRSRGLDPEDVGLELVRGLPEGLGWRLRGFAGYEAVLPAFDLGGRLASLQARRVEGKPRERAPSGPRKVVFANPAAVELLAGRGDPSALVVVAEGEGDWLLWSVRRPDLAVLGVVSGMDKALGERLAELGAERVALRTHPDKDGDGYARKLGRALLKGAPGAQLYRYRPESRIPVADAEKAAQGYCLDDGDRFKAGLLPLDPHEGCDPWTPPAEKPGKPAATGKAALRPARVRAAAVEATQPEEVVRLVRSVLRPAGKALPVVQDRRPTGAGKTTLAAAELVAGVREGRRYAFATFSHEHADESILPALSKAGATIWRDWQATKPEGDVIAAKIDAFSCPLPGANGPKNTRRYQRLASRGWNPVATVCRGCQRFRSEAAEPCGYWRRRRLVQAEAEILVTVHHSARPGSQAVEGRAALVLDEEPASALVKGAGATWGQLDAFYLLLGPALDELKGLAQAARERKGKAAGRAFAELKAAEGAFEEVMRTIGAREGDEPGLLAWLDDELGPTLLRGELPPVAEVRPVPGVDPERLAAGLDALERGCELALRSAGGAARRARNLIPFFRRLAEAWATGQPALATVEAAKGHAVRVSVPYVEPLPDMPILALDATGAPEVLELATGREVQAIEGELRAPLRGVVVADAACGRRRWREQEGQPGKLAQDAQMVAELVGRSRQPRPEGRPLRVGLLTHREHLPGWTAELEERLGAEVKGLYYGGARGSNAFEGWADVVILAGSPFVNKASLARWAILFGAGAEEVRAACDDSRRDAWERRLLPSGEAVSVLRLPSEATQRAHEALVHNELEQALGRASRYDWTPPLGVIGLASPWATRHPLTWTTREGLGLAGPSADWLGRAAACAEEELVGDLEPLIGPEGLRGLAALEGWTPSLARRFLAAVGAATRGDLACTVPELVQAIGGGLAAWAGGPARLAEVAGVSLRSAQRWAAGDTIPPPEALLPALGQMGHPMRHDPYKNPIGGVSPPCPIDARPLVERAVAQAGGVAKLAESLGVSRRTVGRWLKGDTTPREDLADALEVLLAAPTETPDARPATEPEARPDQAVEQARTRALLAAIDSAATKAGGVEALAAELSVRSHAVTAWAAGAARPSRRHAAQVLHRGFPGGLLGRWVTEARLDLALERELAGWGLPEAFALSRGRTREAARLALQPEPLRRWGAEPEPLRLQVQGSAESADPQALGAVDLRTHWRRTRARETPRRRGRLGRGLPARSREAEAEADERQAEVLAWLHGADAAAAAAARAVLGSGTARTPTAREHGPPTRCAAEVARWITREDVDPAEAARHEALDARLAAAEAAPAGSLAPGSIMARWSELSRRARRPGG